VPAGHESDKTSRMVLFVETAFAGTLGLSALLSAHSASRARPAARAYGRFAAILYGVLAIPDPGGALIGSSPSNALADTPAAMVSALAPAALALALYAAFESPPRTAIAACVLVSAAVTGILSVATGALSVAFAASIAAACAMLVLGLRHWRRDRNTTMQALAGAGALLAGAAAFATGDAEGRIALVLFSAAGLLGLSLALAKPSNALVEDAAARGTISILRISDTP
jgi:hypothetical protein